MMDRYIYKVQGFKAEGSGDREKEIGGNKYIDWGTLNDHLSLIANRFDGWP